MNLEHLQDKKIAIVGMGVNNQKLASFFDAHGIVYETIADWKRNSDLVGQLDRFDILFRTPGLPYMAPAIQQAQSKGVEISSQTKLFFDLCPAKIIGVTGTKGKGTTSTLAAKILEAGGYKVWLAGNIGTDPFEFIDSIKPEDLVVLELSSFQLQDLHRSPHIAVVLNITADHLDESGTYNKSAHGSISEYFDAKLQIIAHQTAEDFAVISHELPSDVQNVGHGQKIIFDPKDVEDYEYIILGKHNLENIAAASAVGKILKVPEDLIRQAVKNFPGLPHRLQKVLEKDGITYVEDSISTNEDSTIAAIQAFAEPVILIVGGSSKGLEYKKLGKTIKSAGNLKAVVAVGEEAPKILKNMEGYSGKIFTGAKNMQEIISQAKSIATAGDVVLLSPAAASFDMFKNYRDRAEQFVTEIKK
ncbi:MAG: UDP-N-acetylmuramoyl-L-alanine--D-glutamate ligase [Candidatus Doudnabacteria bacterium]|nr:UDP-N-acetylmuramoyl-L-alanine--D-glutamate ligase [Candidatus Doudnabacteria bacterium]